MEEYYMDQNMQNLWQNLHKQNRFRPKYPAELIVQYVFKNFTKDKSTKVLDIGCGAGRHVYFMANENIDAYGVDISQSGIEYTTKLLKENGVSANLEISSMDKLPFEDNYFEGIICYGVLYYCKNKEIKNAVQEMKRVLVENGKGLVVVRNKKDYRYGKGKEIEKNTFLIKERDKSKCAFNENGMTMHFFDRKEVEELFKEFKEVEIDEVIETHENGKYCDSNFVIKFEK
ncbi:class I SAM-dependent methyltransferase [Clostridium botulinum]|nr:class I SAM-dependent methyltransferase [Clostridium botulinum]